MRRKTLIVASFLICASCAHNESEIPRQQVSTQSNTNAAQSDGPDPELMKQVGERVTLTGTYSEQGVYGSFVVVNNQQMSMRPAYAFPTDKYHQLEGKQVRITGVLRYAHYTGGGQHPPDGFYFESETVTIELAEK